MCNVTFRKLFITRIQTTIQTNRRKGVLFLLYLFIFFYVAFVISLQLVISLKFPLVGAGIFVTTIVAGSIQLRTSFKLARRPFIRDLVFYISAVCWTFAVMYRKEIQTAEAAVTCEEEEECVVSLRNLLGELSVKRQSFETRWYFAAENSALLREES